MKFAHVVTMLICFGALLPLACSSKTDTSSTSGGDGGSGGSGPLSCATVDGCADDAYCDFPDDRCGAGEIGVCQPRLMVCSDGALILCSCSGTIEYAGCAETLGFDTNIDATACTGPSSVLEPVFACGDRFCRTGVTYCKQIISDVNGVADIYSCESVPAACGGLPSCGCLLDEPCGSVCKDGANGGITLTCSGG